MAAVLTLSLEGNTLSYEGSDFPGEDNITIEIVGPNNSFTFREEYGSGSFSSDEDLEVEAVGVVNAKASTLGVVRATASLQVFSH